ncbi:PKD domain-containing protein [Flavihumibacter petaseus]|uniref:PKD domain-containing protein n=1 Tax=Flavihumibacter petaseus NBRC 106054 TaxID=1220578 RepID=A0A0E9N0W4_9BACT|nr:PKD domain-containing protein [Flavihumibacter petaseus]GAO43005.1 hypothetical protein FPE01S_02_01100 [Flavihumibacter petaseus NBRC 106054]
MERISFAFLLLLTCFACGKTNCIDHREEASKVAFDYKVDPGDEAPYTVHFTNLSTRISGSLWDFGDGSVSEEASPVYVYGSAGQYDVRLTVKTTEGRKAVKILIKLPEEAGVKHSEGSPCEANHQ